MKKEVTHEKLLMKSMYRSGVWNPKLYLIKTSRRELNVTVKTIEISRALTKTNRELHHGDT